MSWQAQRTMTAHEFAVIQKKLKLTKAAAARYLDVSSSTVRRYSRGAKDIPVAQALLLRSLVAHGEAPLVPAWTEAWERRQ